MLLISGSDTFHNKVEAHGFMSRVLLLWIHKSNDLRLGGAGGSRTLVQTGKPYAFYTLILALIFVLRQDPGHQPQPYPQRFHLQCEAIAGYSRYCCAAESESLGKTASERRLVLSPSGRIKPVIYCTSIRQREHSCCCQINLTTRRF